ncbi:28841_t:CDS:2, partial [Dentiscutata erythropus]
ILIKENNREVRNILIVGRSGSEKSSLANNLFNEESDFMQENIRYCLADTIGLGDTKLTDKEVLYSIAKTIGLMKEGISHLLFIISDRFNQEERENFRLIKKVMFESNIGPYTTIVRTNFGEFNDETVCDSDRQDLIKESKEIKDTIEDMYHAKRQAKIKKKATRSLKNNYKENFKLKSWDKIYIRINEYISKSIMKDNQYDTIFNDVAMLIRTELPSMILIKKTVHVEPSEKSESSG